MSATRLKKDSRARCSVFAAGDTSPPTNDPHSVFAGIRNFLREADIRFCQAERVFSRPAPTIATVSGIGAWRITIHAANGVWKRPWQCCCHL